MKTRTKTRLATAALLLGESIGCLAQGGPAGTAANRNQSGEFLFDKETFGGNGRTCVTCHTEKTGTFSILEAQARFAENPNDTLFRAPDSDNGDGLSYTRLLTTGLIKVDVPLAPNIRI